MKNVGILVCAGRGDRFSSETPKQFCLLNHKPLYQHALEAFQSTPQIHQIILAVPETRLEQIQNNHQSEQLTVIAGGNTRQETVYLSLQACPEDTDTVVIHDAARPILTPQTIEEHIEKTRLYQAVDTCIPSSDTLVHSSNGQFIEDIPPREHYLRGLTPQSFSYPLILSAHEKALAYQISNATDDCQLALKFGHRVFIFHGDPSNIKITHPIDLKFAEVLLEEREKAEAQI